MLLATAKEQLEHESPERRPDIEEAVQRLELHAEFIKACEDHVYGPDYILHIPNHDGLHPAPPPKASTSSLECEQSESEIVVGVRKHSLCEFQQSIKALHDPIDRDVKPEGADALSDETTELITDGPAHRIQSQLADELLGRGAW